MPYIAPFTGAAFLRDAEELDNVVNLRASYNQETEEMVESLIEDLGITEIAVLFQDDSFGRAGYNGVLAALDRRDMTPTAVGSYTRNTTAVKTAMLDIQLNDPDAVIIIGAYKPAAAMIAWSRFTNFNPVFINISFVGSNALKEELGPYGIGVYVTQVVPFPTDDSIRWWPNTWRHWRNTFPERSPVSFRWRGTWPAVWPRPFSNGADPK